ncbi:hypothetical protein RBSWK_02968 [Rhodopirellula baltica SWK14]|uniref:Uncharacterized protein n=1 Tax=Rhodopirellula baltica SWK14 TaxID=993516 RepID=L7CHL8_RHOBT|nr:hypothetical protein RBSWK_02968 [Rhodopirellula baltica SWK14]
MRSFSSQFHRCRQRSAERLAGGTGGGAVQPTKRTVRCRWVGTSFAMLAHHVPLVGVRIAASRMIVLRWIYSLTWTVASGSNPFVTVNARHASRSWLAKTRSC